MVPERLLPYAGPIVQQLYPPMYHVLLLRQNLPIHPAFQNDCMTDGQD